MSSISKKLIYLIFLCLCFLSFVSAVAIGEKRPATDSPPNAAPESKKIKEEDKWNIPNNKGVYEQFTPDTNDKKVSYDELYRMAVQYYEKAMSSNVTPKIQLDIKKMNGGDPYVNSFLVGVAHYNKVGYAISTVPFGPHKHTIKDAISSKTDLAILKSALGNAVNDAHVEDNLYRLLVEQAVKSGKLDPKATKFPEDAHVTVAIHGTLREDWEIVEGDNKNKIVKLKNPANRGSERGPCTEAGSGSRKINPCIKVAETLGVINMKNHKSSTASSSKPKDPVDPPKTPEKKKEKPEMEDGSKEFGTPIKLDDKDKKGKKLLDIMDAVFE